MLMVATCKHAGKNRPGSNQKLCLLSAVGGGVLLGVVLAALSLYYGPKPLERDK